MKSEYLYIDEKLKNLHVNFELQFKKCMLLLNSGYKKCRYWKFYFCRLTH